jgi:hypothetical protein
LTLTVPSAGFLGSAAQRAIAERDAAIAERDAAIAQREAILKSTSWRITKPLRTLNFRYDGVNEDGSWNSTH